MRLNPHNCTFAFKGTAALPSSMRELNELLAEVFSLKDSNEGVRNILNALHDVFPDLEKALLVPGQKICEEGSVLALKIILHEALDTGAGDQDPSDMSKSDVRTGVTIGDLTLLREELARKELMVPFPDLVFRSPANHYFIVVRKDCWDEPRIAAFTEWLIEERDTSIADRHVA